jgi:FkbM family methyltransferase
MNFKKLIRTLQVEFPFLLDLKFAVMRYWRAVLRRPFERDFAALPLLRPPQGAEFLDVGANRGQSIEAIHMVCPQVIVRAFEPNVLLFDKLRSRFGDCSWVRLENVGLGAEVMEATLYVPFYKRWMFDGLASFDEREARGWLPGRMYFYSDQHLRVETSVCRLRRLDDLDASPFFIKIDVQGLELEVLRGARQTLQRYHPVLLIEAPGKSVLDFLEQLGYTPCAYANGHFMRGEHGNPNTFFMTEGAISRLNESAGEA